MELENGIEAKPIEDVLSQYETTQLKDVKVWFRAAHLDDLPQDGGVCVKYKHLQIALFSFDRIGKWYACQNVCPHKLEMVISRGMIGEDKGIPKVACPLHKKTFSLETGKNINGDVEDIAVYPVKIKDGYAFIGFNF